MTLKVIVKVWSYNSGSSELWHTTKKCLQFLTLHLPFFVSFRSEKKRTLEQNYHLEYFGIYFSWWNRHMHIKMFHSNTENIKPRVCQSHVCYLPTIHSSTLNHSGKYFFVRTLIISKYKDKEKFDFICDIICDVYSIKNAYWNNQISRVGKRMMIWLYTWK